MVLLSERQRGPNHFPFISAVRGAQYHLLHSLAMYGGNSNFTEGRASYTPSFVRLVAQIINLPKHLQHCYPVVKEGAVCTKVDWVGILNTLKKGHVTLDLPLCSVPFPYTTVGSIVDVYNRECGMKWSPTNVSH